MVAEGARLNKPRTDRTLSEIVSECPVAETTGSYWYCKKKSDQFMPANAWTDRVNLPPIGDVIWHAISARPTETIFVLESCAATSEWVVETLTGQLPAPAKLLKFLLTRCQSWT